MTTTKSDPITQEDESLIELGGILISRYLQVVDYRSQNDQSASECPSLLKKLEKLLSSFLDRSSPNGVTLINFSHSDQNSYFIEFNAPFKAGIKIESTLASLFDTQPNPFTFERYMGAATDCFKLSQRNAILHTPSPKPKEIGISPHGE